MNEKQKAKVIIKTLNKIYPKAPVPLKSKNTFTLLISVLLSAQCTDVNVNNVTKDTIISTLHMKFSCVYNFTNSRLLFVPSNIIVK